MAQVDNPGADKLKADKVAAPPTPPSFPDHNSTFSYLYSVQYSPGTGTFRIVNAQSGDGVKALVNPTNDPNGFEVTDDIDNSSVNDEDKSWVLGDRPGDEFTITGTGGLDGTYKFISVATVGGTTGIIAQKGGTYYFLSDTAYSGGNSAADRTLHPFNNVDDAICFMAGTLILTPDGEVAVENLKPGDLVTTLDGTAETVRWVGRQTVSTLFCDELRLPVRIKSGALAESVPSRDLLVSTDHAIFLDGILVQAGALVNGVSIVREANVPTIFTYFHIEVKDHALVLADGALAETFIDNVQRYSFDNRAEYEALYPNREPMTELSYPRVKAVRQLPRTLREKLAARAAALGYAAAQAA